MIATLQMAKKDWYKLCDLIMYRNKEIMYEGEVLHSSDIYQYQLKNSYQYCVAYTKRIAKNFYHGIQLCAPKVQMALCAIYTWMHILDDIVDGVETRQHKLKKIQQFYIETTAITSPSISTSHGFPQGEYWLAFRDTLIHYQIPLKYLEGMFEGQKQDLQHSSFNNFEQLYHYCYCVASTVGLICIKIWGYVGGAATEKLAEWRGIAFQLTNILRDVSEDIKKGRNYLPGGPKDKQQKEKAIQELIAKTNEYFEKSKNLEKYIDKNGLVCLQVMTSIYYEIFNKIKQKPKLILNGKIIKLSFLRKLWITVKTLIMKNINTCH